MTDDRVCKGSWSLGTACGTCSRCVESRPAWEAQGRPTVAHVAVAESPSSAVAAGFAEMWRRMGITQADCATRSGPWTRIELELRDLLVEAVGDQEACGATPKPMKGKGK